MSRQENLRAFFVDQRAFQQAKKVLGGRTDAEVIRLAIETGRGDGEILAVHGKEPAKLGTAGFFLRS